MAGKVATLVTLTILAGLSGTGCDYPSGSDPVFRPYLIKVDSLTVTARYGANDTRAPLAVSDTMWVHFFGSIGPQGNYEFSRCHEFSHIDTTRIDPIGYRVRVWGKEDIRPNRGCAAPALRMRGTLVLEFLPPLRVGAWVFLVSQPDGSVLRKEAVIQ